VSGDFAPPPRHEFVGGNSEDVTGQKTANVTPANTTEIHHGRRLAGDSFGLVIANQEWTYLASRLVELTDFTP